MERKYISDVKSGKVLVKGWVHDTRSLGKIKFLVLRDMTGIIQITAVKGKIKDDIFKKIDKINRESVISVEGSVVKNNKAPSGLEIIPDKFEIISEADEKLPIDVSDFSKTDLSKRLDYRFLDLHRKKIQAIFKIQSVISTSFREFFINKGFIEFQPPSIISSSSEGGTDLFPAKYFEKQAFLAQSPQLYKQMVACSMEKVMTITPVWRAEKHNTIRHLNESRQMDIEMAFTNQKQIMEQLEEVVKYIVQQVIEKNKQELELLDVKLKIPKGVYLSYGDAIKKVKGKIGEDFTPEQERKLCDMYKGDIVFTYSWPSKIKPFYIMPKDENEKSELSEGFDALYNGIEISSGGQRVHLPELLIKMLKKKKLNPKNFKYYIDSFRFGAPSHSGWSIGLERFTMVLLGLDNIREVVMFPRDRDRLVP